MRTLDLQSSSTEVRSGFSAALLLEKENVAVRRIELARGASIPPCQMEEDVVFVVMAGAVTFRSEGQESLVTAPGAVFIPGGSTTRSMEAREPSLVLGVLCRSAVSVQRDEAP